MKKTLLFTSILILGSFAFAEPFKNCSDDPERLKARSAELQQPDHFYQTFLWAKKAVDLGDQKSKWLMAAGIDRYLNNSGYKQLFATQATKDDSSPCWCLSQVEASFPEERRLQYGGKTLAKALEWVDSLNDDPACKPAKQCAKDLKDSPAGTVPGFW